MSIPPFPLVGVHLRGMAASEAIKVFLDQRPDERWVLLGEHAAQGDDQLWTAWIQATRNELRGTMVARTVDAEFLRYLAGTHHISEAFARAGVKDEQENAWILHLPLAEGRANDLGHLQPIASSTGAFEEHHRSLVQSLKWALNGNNISYSIEGARLLGVDFEGWSDDRQIESLVAHVLMADDQSSSHR